MQLIPEKYEAFSRSFMYYNKSKEIDIGDRKVLTFGVGIEDWRTNVADMYDAYK